MVYSDYLEKERKFLEKWRAKGRNRSTMPASFLFYRPLDLLRRAAIPEGQWRRSFSTTFSGSVYSA